MTRGDKYHSEAKKAYRKRNRKNKRENKRLEKLQMVIFEARVEEEDAVTTQGLNTVAEPLLLLQEQPQQNVDGDIAAELQQNGEYDDYVEGATKRLPISWTRKEVLMLKRLYYRFARNGRATPWKKILKYGSHVFDSRRTSEHLRDKWRRMRQRGLTSAF